MDSIEHLATPAPRAPAETKPAETKSEEGSATADQPAPAVPRHPLYRWLLHDLPYTSMLLMAVAGVTLRLPFIYWVVLIPLFGIISTVLGWRRTVSREARLELVWKMALNWLALLLAIFLLFNGSVSGVLNANGISLAMLTLLALGTFTAGVQARDWRICFVGGLLFLAVPGLGWLDQSPLFLTAAAALVIALGGVAWWISQNPDRP